MLLMDRKAPHLQERGGGFAELIGDQEVTISFIALHLAQWDRSLSLISFFGGKSQIEIHLSGKRWTKMALNETMWIEK